MDTTENLSFERKYILKAQTPIIHFQHSQSGATLRASEVKPKLDEFLKRKIGDAIDSKWLLESNGGCSFNYKLRFVALGAQKRTEPPKIYYGNMNLKQEDRVYCVSGDCTMKVICFIPELMQIIDKYIVEFFVCTNFGRMQNKGFGSFIVNGKCPGPEEIGSLLKKNAGAKTCYVVTGYKPTDTDRIFEDIAKLYSIMKSGYNFGDYHRSYLFEYFHEKMGIGNEKALMKKKEISPYKDGQPVKKPSNKRVFPEQNSETYKYVRALLGVGDHIEYISGFKWGTNKRGIEGWQIDGRETIKIKNDNIERLASPIFFKIINQTVFIVARRVNEKVLNQAFTFTNSKTGKSIRIDVPESFDIDDFLEYFVTRYNKDSSAKNERGRNVSYSIEKRITELKGGLL